MIAPFRKVRSQDNVIRQLQGAIDLVFQGILSREILDGTLIKDVALVTGKDNQVEHTLQTAAQGYIVVKKNAQATIWDTEASNKLQQSFLNLRTSSNCTVSLWVF